MRKILSCMALLWFGGFVHAAGEGTLVVSQELDKAFIIKASQTGRDEVADSRLAIKLSTREDIRTVAGMLKTEHERLNTDLAVLVKNKGWVIPEAQTRGETPLTAAAYSDRGFIDRQIAGHEQAIEFYKKEDTAGADPSLRELARRVVPSLEKHLESLRALPVK